MTKLSEISTLSELWQSPAWKTAAREFIKNKPCSWCGVKPGDTYKTRKGKTRKCGFAPHHIEKHKWGLPLYNQVKNRMFRDYYKAFTSRIMFMYPPNLSKKEHRQQEKTKWENTTREAIQANFRAEKTRILDDYRVLTDENAVVLCNQCHYARENGLILCKKCEAGFKLTFY